MVKKFSLKKLSFIFAFIATFIISSIFSLSVLAAKPTRDTTPPTAPSNLKAATVTENSVSLTWSPSTDNVSVTSYHIYKNSVDIGYTSSASYNVTGLTPGTPYQFYVKAKDAAGNYSLSSNVISVTTLQKITQAAPKRMVGYYASWSAYSGYTPDKIDASKLNYINYAFANIGSDLKIALGDSSVDPTNFAKLNALKQTYPNLKTLISVGGWSWSGKFSDVAYTDASRNAFADSCVQFILQYGFDGVDIDWEYPVSGGMSSNVTRPEDKHDFTLLLQAIRAKLNAQSAIDGKKYLLTIAGGDGSFYVNNTELGTLQQYLDYANIMTYDIHGTWDTYTDFNAPLYNTTASSPQYKWSVDSAVKSWLSAGMPADKIVVGIPFYGNKYTGVTNGNNGLFQTFTGGSSITYASIAANYLNAPGYIRYFDSQSMVPWLFNGSTFISYDDPQSIGLKAQYIKNGNLGGAMVWELSQDSNGTLLNALYSGLQQ